jgi:hypothetical protein
VRLLTELEPVLFRHVQHTVPVAQSAMGKTGDAIQAVAAMAIVAASIPDTLDDCRNVEATACPSLPPEQHHSIEGQPETPQSARSVAAGGGTATYPRATGISVTPV